MRKHTREELFVKNSISGHFSNVRNRNHGQK